MKSFNLAGGFDILWDCLTRDGTTTVVSLWEERETGFDTWVESRIWRIEEDEWTKLLLENEFVSET